MPVKIILIILFLWPSCTFAEIRSFLNSEAINVRISDLNPPDKGLPESEFSLADERRAVESEISSVRASTQRSLDRTKDIELIDKVKTSVVESLSLLARTNCQELPDGKFVIGSQIRSQLSSLDRRVFSLDLEEVPNPWIDGVDLLRPGTQTNDQEQCQRWKLFVGDSTKQAPLISYFDNLKGSLAEQVKRLTELKTQATTLMDLLQKRKDAIEKKLATSSTQAALSDKLWIVIGLIGVLSIGAILAVKLFSEAIQIEWVASGQVIQFVTVMILLSVILALGLAGILKENTLGTLLGGIAGYVLAQGVGRAAAREVTRQRESGK